MSSTLFVLLAGGLRAQAPEITPAGDPSVRADTIYALAVDPAQYPEEDVVWLLDDGVLRLERDGTGTRTYRVIAQILRQGGVDAYSEHTFGYDGVREELVLNWIRVVEPDGTVVSEEPLHVQDLDAPVPESSPIYSQRKLKRVSLANVAPGRIVDYSYTLRVKEPVLARDFYSSWFVTPGRTIRRSRLIIDLPQDAQPHLVERNLDFEPEVVRRQGRVIRTWYRADIERIEPELFAADSNGVHQSVRMTGEATWSDIGRWYAGLSRDRLQLAPELAAKLAEVTRGAASRLDSLRAVHRWVAQDIRYVSIALGLGGYQPRPPLEVLQTASGDCKDKATLFVTLARALGWEAYPVLVNSSTPIDTRLPSIESFDHVIAAVRLDGRWHYTDLTADLVPFDHTAPSAYTDHGLLVRDDGSSELMPFEQPRAEQHRSHTRLSGTLSGEGGFSGVFEQDVTGYMEYEIRGTFTDSLSEREQREVAAAVAAAIIRTASADSIRVGLGRDLAADQAIRLWLRADQVLKPAAQGWVFMLPLETYGNPAVLAQLQREKARRFTFDAGQVFGAREFINELSVTLPDGWAAELPPAISARSAFGSYEASYTQQGNVLHVRRVVRGNREVLPPSAKQELIDWLREIGRDDVEFVILHPRKD